MPAGPFQGANLSFSRNISSSQVSRNNPWGCTPCFCYGHTEECESAPRMVGSSVTSDFSRGPEDWVAEESGRPTTSSYNAYQVMLQSTVSDDFATALISFFPSDW